MGFLYNILDDFLGLLFPRICHGCGEHLLQNEDLLCLDCLVSIPRTGYHRFPDNPVEKLLWGRCMVEKAAAFSFYTKGSRIRKIVHDLKYRGARELGPLMGRIYASDLSRDGFFDGIDLIIPVPLHPARQRKRGFNQSELICDGLAEISGLPVDKTILKRIRFSETQTRRSRYDRWQNVEGIFGVENASGLSGKHVLLVDDVITTGSTIEASVNALSKTENIRISVIALGVAVM
ncbi:MAG: ComF family protein [Bacteroidales bacterium]